MRNVLAGPLVGAVPDAQKPDAATFRFAGLSFQGAGLFTKGGRALEWSQDFASEMAHRLSVFQDDLTESALSAFARMGAALPIEAKLKACVTHVKKSDVFLVVTKGVNKIRSLRNGWGSWTLSHPNMAKGCVESSLGPNARSAVFNTRLRGR